MLDVAWSLDIFCHILNIYTVANVSNTYVLILISVMVNCVTKKAVILLKTIIAFTIIAMCCTLLAFLLDLMGPQHRALKILRRNAIFNIVSGEFII